MPHYHITYCTMITAENDFEAAEKGFKYFRDSKNNKFNPKVKNLKTGIITFPKIKKSVVKNIKD